MEGWGKAIDAMKRGGAKLIDTFIPDLGSKLFPPEEITVLTYELQRDMKSYLGTIGNSKMKTLKDLLDYYTASRDGRTNELFELSVIANNETAYNIARAS